MSLPSLPSLPAAYSLPARALCEEAFGYMGLKGSLALYATYVAIGSTYIFVNFAVSHTHKDVVPKTKCAGLPARRPRAASTSSCAIWAPW